MKKSLVTSLIAVPALALSSVAFAAEPASPMQLTAKQMDGVTAGNSPFPVNPGVLHAYSKMFKHADVTQINVSPVTIVQIGNYNTAIVYSGNFSTIRQ